jgi:hypothetical protein
MDPENWIALGLSLPLPDVKIRLIERDAAIPFPVTEMPTPRVRPVH